MRDDDVATFRRDGVVRLREVMPAAWIARLRDAVEVALGSTATTDLSAMADALVGADPSSAPRGQFRAGTDHWVASSPSSSPSRVSRRCPASWPSCSASDQIWLYEDSVLVKEPGTVERTHFHQDLAYFHVDGDQVCTVWVPLDAVDAENGAVQYVRGSHRDRTPLRPNLFVTTDTLPGSEGEAVSDASDDPALVAIRHAARRHRRARRPHDPWRAREPQHQPPSTRGLDAVRG